MRIVLRAVSDEGPEIEDVAELIVPVTLYDVHRAAAAGYSDIDDASTVEDQAKSTISLAYLATHRRKPPPSFEAMAEWAAGFDIEAQGEPSPTVPAALSESSPLSPSLPESVPPSLNEPSGE